MSIREKPKLFIGSSAESIGLAEALRNQLGDSVEAKVWTEGIFELSEHTMASLIKALSEFDFAAFLFSPDDVVKIRNRNYEAVRDNIVFELGLFIGGLGLKRTYFVMPSDCKDLRIPSDLLGITPATYTIAAFKENPEESLRNVAAKIKEAISVEWERPYNDQTYARFQEIESRVRRCLVTQILLAENADELPNKSELESQSLSTIWKINSLAKIKIKDELAQLGFLHVDIVLAQAQGKGDSWGQKQMDLDLRKLEKSIDEWEDNIRRYRPPNN